MTAPYWLNFHDPEDFPDVGLALREPDGLLAIGGDLSVERLLAAYRHGIFPWYSDEQPILWWSPDPRSVLVLEKLSISRSLRKILKKRPFTVTLDQAFDEVVFQCSQPRKDEHGTWITDEIMEAYKRLHQAGYGHSVECWQDNQLVGGLYGVALGRMFFGESMFSRVSNASKIGFVHLAQQLLAWNYPLIDCQIQSVYLDSFGAENIPRATFTEAVELLCQQPGHEGPWCLDPALTEHIATTGTILF